MTKIHHIHPHVINNHNNSDSDFSDFSDFNDPFDKIFKQHDFNNKGNHSNSQSFSASYSNINGHVHKHFTKDGHPISSNKAKDIMKHMHQNADSMLKEFGDLGKTGLNDALEYGQTMKNEHPLKKLINHYHNKNKKNK